MSNDFPLPPGFKPKNLPPEEDTKLSDDEMLFICKKYLTPRQFSSPPILAFIQSYFYCRNAAQASRDSGAGPNTRQNPQVHACIEALTAKAVMKYGYDAHEVMERVKEMAGIDPIEFENPDGSYKTHMSQIKPEARRAIKEFTVKNLWGEDANGMRVVIGQLIEVKLFDKLKATELLGREKNLMKETKKVEHDVTARMADLLLESSRLADERQLGGGGPSLPVIEIEGRVDENKSAIDDVSMDGGAGDTAWGNG